MDLSKLTDEEIAAATARIQEAEGLFKQALNSLSEEDLAKAIGLGKKRLSELDELIANYDAVHAPEVKSALEALAASQEAAKTRALQDLNVRELLKEFVDEERLSFDDFELLASRVIAEIKRIYKIEEE